MSAKPEVLSNLQPEQLVQLDVRPVLAGGTDPFQLIMGKINELGVGQVLEIINTFIPAPLITVLGRKGYSAYTDMVNDQLVHTYFYKDPAAAKPESSANESIRSHWDEVNARFADNLVFADVRDLEMPEPMIRILETLDTLPEGKALFVYHKKLPVFLLPELKERKFDYRVNEIAPGEVHLLIFRP
jgi:uncharacterized protein (DUF2249 family)